ncbi:MAG: MFS transporter [Casimicrobiaceae bacterium]
MTPPRLWRLIPALGIAQVISWGALYYSIAVLGGSIRADLEVGETTLFGAYSWSLLLSGVFAPATGRAIDRWGGRAVMSAGSVLGGIALLAIGLAQGVVSLYFGWSLAGIAMAMTLYDPAFATLSQHTGASYRKALTALTLFGGLASTVFWPLSLGGLSVLGWRETLVGFALLELLVCLPLHRAFIPPLAARVPVEVPSPTVATDAAPPSRVRHAGRAAFIALAAAFAMNGFVVSALSVHLITVLEGKSFTLATAVWAASFIGPMQVAGRAMEFTVGRRLASRTIGMLAFSGVAVATLLLIVIEGEMALALVFALLYGASNGVLTIVRGVVPAELFGRVGFGRTLGRLGAPALVARAIAPLACAGMAAPGATVVVWLGVLTLFSLAALGAFTMAITRR